MSSELKVCRIYQKESRRTDEETAQTHSETSGRALCPEKIVQENLSGNVPYENRGIAENCVWKNGADSLERLKWVVQVYHGPIMNQAQRLKK